MSDTPHSAEENPVDDNEAARRKKAPDAYKPRVAPRARKTPEGSHVGETHIEGMKEQQFTQDADPDGLDPRWGFFGEGSAMVESEGPIGQRPEWDRPHGVDLPEGEPERPAPANPVEESDAGETKTDETDA